MYARQVLAYDETWLRGYAPKSGRWMCNLFVPGLATKPATNVKYKLFTTYAFKNTVLESSLF